MTMKTRMTITTSTKMINVDVSFYHCHHYSNHPQGGDSAFVFWTSGGFFFFVSYHRFWIIQRSPLQPRWQQLTVKLPRRWMTCATTLIGDHHLLIDPMAMAEKDHHCTYQGLHSIQSHIGEEVWAIDVVDLHLRRNRCVPTSIPYTVTVVSYHCFLKQFQHEVHPNMDVEAEHHSDSNIGYYLVLRSRSHDWCVRDHLPHVLSPSNTRKLQWKQNLYKSIRKKNTNRDKI